MKVREYRIRDDERAVMAEVWDVIRKHKENVSPMETLAILAQVMGATIACGGVDMNEREKLSELISMNLEVGFDGMLKALDQISGHA